MKSLVGAARGTWWGAGVAGAVCIVFAVVGCGSGAVEGSPTTATQSGQPAFDPCSLPDEALVAAGVDPGTKDPDVFGVQMQGWEVCTWSGDWYFLSVFATSRSLDEVRTNASNIDFTPVAVGDTAAFTYREVTDTAREYCDLALEGQDGALIIRVATKGSRDAPEDPCLAVVRTATLLAPGLPL